MKYGMNIVRPLKDYHPYEKFEVTILRDGRIDWPVIYGHRHFNNISVWSNAPRAISEQALEAVKCHYIGNMNIVAEFKPWGGDDEGSDYRFFAHRVLGVLKDPDEPAEAPEELAIEA